MLKGFRDFILRGNVIDMAVGVIVGAAFNGVVASMVKDLIQPLIKSTVGQPNVGSIGFKFHGQTFVVSDVINNTISFLIICAVVYFGVIMPMHWFMQRVKKPDATPTPTTRTCPECLSEIPIAAKRCAHCTQPVPESAPAA